MTVGAGQTLALTQSMLPSVLDPGRLSAVRGLATGGDLFSVLIPGVPDNAWDARPVSLTLGGLLEPRRGAGRQHHGRGRRSADGGQNFSTRGAIRLAGGTITQQEFCRPLYQSFSSGNAITTVTPLGIRALSDIFSVNDDGTISQNAASTYSSSLTNAQLAGAGDTINQHPIYFLGTLDADQGVVLAPGSVTDLSGTSIRNPYAVDPQTGAPIAAGRIVAGGTLATDPRAALPGQTLFRAQTGSTYSVLVAGTGANTAALNAFAKRRDLVIDPGATLDLAGASDVYDLPAASDSASMTVSNLMPTPVWSSAGTLSAGAGATLTGATILAQGGAPQAEGGHARPSRSRADAARSGNADGESRFRRHDRGFRLRYAGRDRQRQFERRRDARARPRLLPRKPPRHTRRLHHPCVVGQRPGPATRCCRRSRPVAASKSTRLMSGSSAMWTESAILCRAPREAAASSSMPMRSTSPVRSCSTSRSPARRSTPAATFA
ncbi:MAG: hypothetical protein WDN03_16260 [Rhizomicrobium sp.]